MNVLRLIILALCLWPISRTTGQTSFSVMGCGPYTPAAEEALSFYLEAEGELGTSSFIVHCGDIVSGRLKTWPEKQFEHIAQILKLSPIPTFIVPGDNEWNDQLDTDSSWKYWQTHFQEFDSKWKLPNGASPVSRQPTRQENFAFKIDEVLFIGINKVSGTIHDPAEWELRLNQNIEWLTEQFTHHNNSTHSAVIFAQASANGGSKSFAKNLGSIGDKYGKPILYVHADGHKWILEPEKWGKHITRLQLDVVNEKFPPLQVTATGNVQNPFILDRRLDNPRMKYIPNDCHWSVTAGGDGADKIRGIANEKSNSIFVTGEISPNTNFGGHPVDSGGSLDFVVAKINDLGNVIWTVSAGGEKIDRGYGVSPSADGGCYVTGHFESDTIQFGEFILKNTGNYDGFIAKFDAKGICQWAKRFGGPDYDYGHGIATAPDGSAVLAATITNRGNVADSKVGIEKGRSAVLAKFTPDGDLIWVKTASGPSTSGHNVTVGNDGMIYLCGYVRGKVAWTEKITTENKLQDPFVAKFNPDGQLQWVRTAGGETDGLATSIAVETKTGNILIAGMFKGTAAFGKTKFTSRGNHDFYFSTLSPDGTFLNAHHGGGPSTDYALSTTALPNGGFGITGEITESAEFNGSNHHATGARDGYIATLNSDGSVVKTFRLIGGNENDLSYAITGLEDGSVIISGAFRNETKFGSIPLKAKKGNDIFIGRFKP